jgi:dTDP-4-dehydrorhamnose 3,5-epimerase-like enzyme
MFKTGPIEGVLVRELVRHIDPRGWLIELFRTDELAPDQQPQMAYVSETLPGASRGPHAHRDQADYFAFTGPGDLTLYLWDARPASATFGYRQTLIVGESKRTAVRIPPGVVHAYKNAGAKPAWVINCPDRLFKGVGRQEPVDETRYEEQPGSPYVLD